MYIYIYICTVTLWKEYMYTYMHICTYIYTVSSLIFKVGIAIISHPPFITIYGWDSNHQKEVVYDPYIYHHP